MEGVSGKLMRSAIVPFFSYGHGNEQLLWRFFLLHATKWSEYVDEIYVIASGFDLDKTDNPKIKIINKPPQSHWQNMNEAIRDTKADQILLLDSDMIIYRPEVIRDNFNKLEKYDFATILDSSGAKMLFPENENRFARGRMCPYLCFFKKDALRLDFDFTPRGNPDWTDSMGTVTEQALEDGKKILELQDDRSTISLEDDGEITSTQWLDTPPKLWAMEENPYLGYYHIRNFGGGLKLLKEQKLSGVPSREALRLLGWVYWLGVKTEDNDLMLKVMELINFKLTPYLGRDYLRLFGEYHSWLKYL